MSTPTDDSEVPASPIFLDQNTNESTSRHEAGSQGQPDVMSTLGQFLVFGLSLPERTVRSTVALAAGAAKATAQFLVPQAFQDSKTYELVIRNSLRFLTEEVGGVNSVSDDEKTPDDFLARKVVGNFIDLAGLATLHVSPIWLMAIFSDVAYGTKTYVLELAEELKKQGLIDETSTIHHVDDVLTALQNASGEAASLFDRPPLSIDQLKRSLDNTRTAITSADYTRVLPEPELTRYWSEMRGIAEKEDVSMLGVSGALTMHILGKVGTVSQGALTGVQVVGGLFSRHIVGHYVSSLETLKTKGLYETVRESSEPYVEALWNNFSTSRETWTEQFVTGKSLGKAVDLVSGWLSGPSEQPETATPDQVSEAASGTDDPSTSK